MSDADIIARLRLNASQFSGELKTSLGGARREAETAAKQINAAFSKVKSIAGGLGIALGVRELAGLSDEYATISARLKLATAESGSFSKAHGDVLRIASQTRAPLSATVELYGAMARNGAALNATQDEIARATETVNKAMRVSGGSAAAAEAGITQLGQALASGVLRGDEFNSMMENSPRLAKLLADSLNVPIGKLRQMAADGELTSDKLFRALTDRKFTAGLDAEFAQLPVTFGEAMTQVQNSALTLFGEFDQGGQFSKSIAGFVSQGSADFATLMDDAREAGVEIRAAFDGLGNVFDPLLENGSHVFDALGIKIAPLRDQIADLIGVVDQVENTLSAPDRFLNGLSRGIDQRLRSAGLGGVADLRSVGAPIPLANRRQAFLDGYDRSAREAEQRRRDAQNQELLKTFTLDGISGFQRDGLPGFSARKAGPVTDSKADKEAEKAAKAAAKRAEQAEKERQRIEENYNKQREANDAELHFLDLKSKGLDNQAELEQRLFQLHQANKDLSAAQLAVLEKQTIQLFGQEQALKSQEAWRAKADRDQQERVRAQEDAIERAQEEQRRQAEEVFRDLGDIYYDIFSGQGGSIWDQFKRRGLSVLADLAAQWTLSFLTGGNVALPSGSIGGGGIMSVLFGGGGFGGTGGTSTGGSSGGFGSGGIGGGAMSLGKSIFGGGFGYDPAAIRLAEAGGGATGAGGLASSLGPIGAGIGAASFGMQMPGLLGIKGSTTGGAIGGVAGFIAGGPIGAAIGAALGSIVGGLFKKKPYGTANVTGIDEYTVRGNKGAARDNAGTLAGSVSDGLQQLADQFGASVGNFNVSIGTYKGKYRVSGSGKTGKLSGGDVVDFGKDGGQQAVEFAVRDAIADGAIKGISAASQRILASGKDLQKSIEQATLIESIPKRLKQIEDPVGAALDDLVAEFSKIKKALDAGGATARQYADAEKLFNIQRQKIVEQTVKDVETLKSYVAGLGAGSSSPLSLRDQEANAKGLLQPFVDKISAGQEVDQAAYVQAAQTFLDIERQIYGSTQGFFDQFNRIQALTNTAIQTVQNATPIVSNNENPFAAQTAAATQTIATGINAQIDILGSNNQLLRLIAERLGGSPSALPLNRQSFAYTK